MAEILYTYDDPPPKRDVERAAKVLANDGIIIYQSDLNWAFVCDAASPKAITKLWSLKIQHTKDKPFALLCSDIAMVADYAQIDTVHYRILKKIWPGPYTVLLRAARSLPKQIKDKRRVVGIRIPESPLMQSIIESHQGALITTSINRKSPHNSELWTPVYGYEVEEAYGHAVNLILDLGRESGYQESTIVDMQTVEPEVIRVGAGSPDIF